MGDIRRKYLQPHETIVKRIIEMRSFMRYSLLINQSEPGTGSCDISEGVDAKFSGCPTSQLTTRLRAMRLTNDRTCRTANRIRSLGSFHGDILNFRPRCEHCHFHSNGIRVCRDIIRQDQHLRMNSLSTLKTKSWFVGNVPCPQIY